MADSRRVDVFNGDADGLCALIQLRLGDPAESELVTGIKRDISLLKRVQARPGDRVTVLDVSLDRNRSDLERLLAAGAEVFYADHHFPGESPPTHPGLTTLIDESPTVCTSLLINQHLGGRFRLWAIAAAFGDNLGQVAAGMCRAEGLSDTDTANLRELGELLNYNGYGSRLEDLHFHPAALFSSLRHLEDPREARAVSPELAVLAQGHAEDMSQVGALSPALSSRRAVAYRLPDESWARRVVGVWANELSRKSPEQAHLILCPDGAGTQTVSLRAPRINPHGASAFCRRYPEGGGREAAAGINHLPESLVSDLIEDFDRNFS